jgi:hypothetical protein
MFPSSILLHRQDLEKIARMIWRELHHVNCNSWLMMLAQMTAANLDAAFIPRRTSRATS